MAKSKPLLGSGFRKISPKLRMLANANSKVSEMRSDFTPSLQMAQTYSLASAEPPSNILDQLGYSFEEAPKPAIRGKLKKLAEDVYVSVFVERDSLDEIETLSKCISSLKKNQITGERGRLATIEVPVNTLPTIAEHPSVVRVEIGETLKQPNPEISNAEVSAPAKSKRKFSNGGGKDVLVGVIDVGGFDFAHPDFLDQNGNTRFERIWDQGGEVRPSPQQFNFGSEITKAHMDAAIEASATTEQLPRHFWSEYWCRSQRMIWIVANRFMIQPE